MMNVPSALYHCSKYLSDRVVGLLLLVLLSLEFMPRRRRLPAATGWE